jgi:uncharacterized protein YndB with AHSA1/START domain
MIGNHARVSVSVAVPPALAFEIFTRDIDRWWRRGFRFRHSASAASLIHLEPRVGGRLFEALEGDDSERVHEVGRVQVWEPPHRLSFTWRNANFAPTEQTRVAVEFVAAGDGTLLTLTHEGLASLPPDHPARHGLQGAEFSRMFGLWWADQLTALRELGAP